MEVASTISSYISDYLNENGYKLQQLATMCGINVGSLSATLTGRRFLSINQLDKLTRVMGHTEGYFYETYAVECFLEAEPHWKRLNPFLIRCSQLDKLDCIERVVLHITDNRSYLNELFELGEQLYRAGLHKAAFILYKCVSESEKYQHSTRLALCQYRIFTIKRTVSQLDNLSIAAQFEPYIEKLEEEIQLDGIKDLANLYLTMQHWDTVYRLAEQLERRVDFQMKIQSTARKRSKRIACYPLYTYKAYANLLKANICEAHQEYEKALEFTKDYEDIVNVINPTLEEQELNERFRKWARGNRYLYFLLMGKSEVLHAYLNYIEENPDEILIALVHIVEAANKHYFNIDEALERFDYFIQRFHTDELLRGTYSDQMLNHRSIRFYYGLAKYRIHQKQWFDGINELLISLRLSVNCEDNLLMIQCIDLYGQHRIYANAVQEQKYSLLVEQMIRKK